MSAPRLYRRVAVASIPDADWAGTQAAPAAALRIDVSAARRIGVVFVPKTAADLVSTGTLDFQCVDVSESVRDPNWPSRPVLRATPVDSLVGVGAGVEYDVSGSDTVAIRVAAKALAGAAAYVEIYWSVLE